MNWKKLKAKSAYVRWGLEIRVVEAEGRLLDRLRRGAEIDFLDIRIFVFNVADGSIGLGVALLCWEFLVHDPHTR